MAGNRQRFILYMCFGTDQEDAIRRSFAVIPGQTEIGKWKSEQRDSGSTDGKSAPDAEDLESTVSEERSGDLPQDSSVELPHLMRRFQEAMSGYKFLVGFGMTLMPTLRSFFIYNEIYKNANKHLEMADKDQQFEIYGITEDQYPFVMTQIRRLREIDRGATVLPGAILLSLVATFDSFIADTLRIMLRSKPKWAIGSSKMISVKEILNMSSFDDVIRKFTDDEVDDLMRGSHDEQIEYIEKILHIDIRNHYEEWGEFIEIFERRNIISHGNYIINSHYVRNCNKHGFQVDEGQRGKNLSLDEEYLSRSSDRLLEFGLSLMFVLRLKHFKDSREIAYKELNNLTYELIKDRQSRVAAKLLNLALFKQTASVSEEIRRTMTVNLANAYKKLGNDKMAQEVITGVDWSATRDEFQICVAAIQGDIERVVELMPKVVQGDLITKTAYREWPVFDWAREEETVREKFQEIYDEPIIDPADEEKSNHQENTSPTSQSDQFRNPKSARA